jgi:endo-1,4-beta-xylanase
MNSSLTHNQMDNIRLIQRTKCISKIKALFILWICFIATSCVSSKKNVVEENDTIPSLYRSFQNDFQIGTAFSTSKYNDSMYVSIVKKHFNSVTAENAMKWEKIHPMPGKYYFAAADSFISFAEKNNLDVVGHVLVWHQQTPEWVHQDEKGKPVSRDTLLNRMRDHIHTVVGRYKGRVNCWDVVNEAIDDDGSVRKNFWYNIIGEDYVAKAFEYAHEADPQAKLIYNDYSLPTPVKRDGVVKLIRSLQAKGIKVDGIGEQGHYHLFYPELQDLDSCISVFSALGVKVMITELDINILPFPINNTGADISLNFELQKGLNPYADSLPDSMQVVLANRYGDFFKIFMKHKNDIDRITFWGINDGQSWLNYWPIRGRTNYPLLFDRKYQPKKAFWTLVDLAKNKY